MFFQIFLLVIFIDTCICNKPCSKLITIKHGTAVDCVEISGHEYVNLKCDLGYEFETNVTKKQVLTSSHIERINCNCKIFINQLEY